MAHSVYLVDPYMVSPKFGLKLLPDRYVRKIQMADPDKLAPIHVSVPVSGAAVQLSYLERLIHLLNRSSDRFVFHIVSQQSPATGVFLNHMIGQPNTELSVSASHREVVALYESLLQDHVVCMEITKPSEQSFKALCDPTERGGVLLLFSAPVGRQERDNLKFLRRHMLIPAQEEQSRLWNLASRNTPADTEIRKLAHQWRGLLMPYSADSSATFFLWALRNRILLSMVHFQGFPQNPELSSEGVKIFWTQMSNYLRSIYP
jgi:hypothetical protein